MNLRKIDFEKETSFECDGKKYFVNSSTLSFTRYRELQKISLEFGFSAAFEDIFKNLKTAIDSYNKHDYFNMSVTLYKIQEGIVNLDTKDDPALRICALFINEENEDITSYNEALMKAKIESWGRELSIEPFFYLVTNLVPYWTNVYELHIRGGLKKDVEENTE
jgi:hypothetical protein